MSHPPTAAPDPTSPAPAPAPASTDGPPETRPAAEALVRWLNAADDPGPRPARPRRRRSLLAGAALLSVALLGAAGWSAFSLLDDVAPNLGLEYQKAERGRIAFTVVEKGEVEAYRNAELLCKVRNRPGDWMATTIKWLI